jgi:hypothetical protein
MSGCVDALTHEWLWQMHFPVVCVDVAFERTMTYREVSSLKVRAGGAGRREGEASACPCFMFPDSAHRLLPRWS